MSETYGEFSSMGRAEIHKRVIEHYGEKAQLGKAMEELVELQCELLNYTGLGVRDNRDKILSELADVCNMIEQIAIIFEFMGLEIVTEQNQKMIRTLKRIDADDKSGET